jgi:septal ring factor EnvC (AmiA/AmiB activator)
MNRIAGYFILFLTVTGVSSAILLLPAAAHADKALEIQKALANKKATHAALTEKAKALDSEISDLRKNILKVSSDLRLSEESLSETDQHLMGLRQKKASCLENLYKDQQAMGGLLSAARKYSQTSTFSMFVRAKPIDAARAAIVMKSLIPSINQQSSYLQAQLSEIGKIEGKIKEQLQLQMQQNQKLNHQQDALTSLLEDRNKLYQSTESQRQEQEKEVAALTKESRNLEELMQKLKQKSQNSGAATKTARTPLPSNILLPVNGTILTGFGDKDDLGAESKGITFLTRPASRVVVPLSGTVKFAGTFQNYKQILIVEHQGGYHSLIAGLARIDTVVGAALAAGEPVGVAEASASPQIYYELRQNGKPVNPKKLLIAQKKQEKS